MSLFNKLQSPDRQKTQLAYCVKYWPWKKLSQTGRGLVAWRMADSIDANKFLMCCDVCLTKYYPPEAGNRFYQIAWAYNNIPTEQEWLIGAATKLLNIELRVSPAIDCNAVCILSWGAEQDSGFGL